MAKIKAIVITSSVRSASMALPSDIGVCATATEQVATKRYLEVTPTGPQYVMWLVPGNEIEYQIRSNTDWSVE